MNDSYWPSSARNKANQPNKKNPQYRKQLFKMVLKRIYVKNIQKLGVALL